jgi:hypothetical protein
MSNPNDDRATLARGFLLGTSAGVNAPPGSGATVTLFDSSVSTLSSWLDGLPFSRVILNVYSSHDSGASGVVFSSSFDRGTNFRAQASYTYLNANGPTSYDYLMKGGHVKVQYTNSASVLTAWEMELVGVYDRNPGV